MSSHKTFQVSNCCKSILFFQKGASPILPLCLNKGEDRASISMKPILRNKRFSQGSGRAPQAEERKQNPVSSVLTPIKEMHPNRRRFLFGVAGADLALLIGAAFVPSAMLQGILICALFVANLVGAFVFGWFTKRKAITYLQVLSIFVAVLAVVSITASAVGGILNSSRISIQNEISRIKRSSVRIIETDDAKVYFDKNTMNVYTVSDMFGSKYIHTGKLVPAEKSEYYDLYNLGMEIYHEIEGVSDIYVYPPTPSTISGYEYLVEATINNETFVTRIFIPGIVDLAKSASSHMFSIGYGSDEHSSYEVSRVDQYLLFQSEYSTFSTPFVNVDHNENEYFFVRYNRYLREIQDDGEVGEENVRFINSIAVGFKSIERVSFFFVGEVIDDVFHAYLPVMEIVYTDGTSDIAVIKDINAAAIRDIG